MTRKPKKGASAAKRVIKGLLLDIVLIGIGLCVFALFHHVLPSVGVIVVDERTQSEVDPALAEALGALELHTAEPAQEVQTTPAPTEQPTAQPEITPAPEAELTEQPEITPAPEAEPAGTPEPVPSEMPTEAPAPSFSGEEAGEYVPAATQAPAEPDAAETPVPSYAPGDFSALFDRVVSDTDEILVEKDEYLSEDISIRIATKDTGRVVFHVADIYIRNIENLQTAFANDIYGRGQREYAWDISMEKGAVLSVNGDYYGARDDGVVIRNGVLYRDTLYQDVCVLYKDGTMETYLAEEFDCAAAVERGAWQAWSFGPMLLDENSAAMTKFNSVVVNRNPRCGIGYFEPGHYCFVVVEGRNDNSNGVTLAEFSLIFEQLGCVSAYNMDGGNTAVMTYGKRLVSEPSQGGRPVTDIIMITEVDGE